MAHTEENWTLAKDLFMVGKSLSEIETSTGISRGAISIRSNEQEWVKGKNKHLIVEAVGLASKTEQLTKQQNEIHDKEVARLSEFGTSLDVFSKKAMIKANKLMQISETGQDFKAIVDGVDKHSVTVGFNQRHANNQINVDASANANNETKKIIIIDAVAEKAKAEQE